ASAGATILLAVLTVAAILTKPSAVILLPVFLGWLFLEKNPAGIGGWQRIRAGLLYFGIVGAMLTAYAFANQVRFGFFGLSGMTGSVIYWHVHPITRLESGIYPEIKAEMKPAFLTYLKQHDADRAYDGDWAVPGRGGPKGPGVIVRAYAQTHGQGSLFRRENEIFEKLAIEAIRARPLEYLSLSMKGIHDLWSKGLSAWYGWHLLPT